MKRISLPLKKNDVKRLKAGEAVLLSGPVYTARDAAHRRMVESIRKGGKLPFDLAGATVYYTGPTPPPMGRKVGSCGPTTSCRMDVFTPPLLRRGLKGMIGKGRRGETVRKAIKSNKAVYFLGLAGAGAFLSEKVKSIRVIAYKDLGPEAVHEIVLENFPTIVGIDAAGNDLYGGE